MPATILSLAAMGLASMPALAQNDNPDVSHDHAVREIPVVVDGRPQEAPVDQVRDRHRARPSFQSLVDTLEEEDSQLDERRAQLRRLRAMAEGAGDQERLTNLDRAAAVIDERHGRRMAELRRHFGHRNVQKARQEITERRRQRAAHRAAQQAKQQLQARARAHAIEHARHRLTNTEHPGHAKRHVQHHSKRHVKHHAKRHAKRQVKHHQKHRATEQARRSIEHHDIRRAKKLTESNRPGVESEGRPARPTNRTGSAPGRGGASRER